MLFARSPDECQLYMELHPCGCGEEEFAWSRHALEHRDGRLVAGYEGTCGRCGTARQFEFEVAAGYGEHPEPPAYGGDEPSRIVDPGQFLASSQRAAAGVPPHPDLVETGRLADAYEAVEQAVAGIVEVLKFGGDAVPEAAFTSDLGRRMHASDPGRFRRGRLALELAELERIRAAYAAALDAFDHRRL
jgi:hypothetical protein